MYERRMRARTLCSLRYPLSRDWTFAFPCHFGDAEEVQMVDIHEMALPAFLLDLHYKIKHLQFRLATTAITIMNMEISALCTFHAQRNALLPHSLLTASLGSQREKMATAMARIVFMSFWSP